MINDLEIKGVWLLQDEALFDVRVTNAHAPLYMSHSVANVLIGPEEEKSGNILLLLKFTVHLFSIYRYS